MNNSSNITEFLREKKEEKRHTFSTVIVVNWLVISPHHLLDKINLLLSYLFTFTHILKGIVHPNMKILKLKLSLLTQVAPNPYVCFFLLKTNSNLDNLKNVDYQNVEGSQ